MPHLVTVRHMSNELYVDVRLYEKEDGTTVLMVSHEPQDYFIRTKHPEFAKQTRKFCNWIRKTFPHVPTEFRYVNTRQVRYPLGSYWNRNYNTRTVNCDKHFVAYGLQKSELMMIKLAWIYKTEKIYLTSLPSGVTDGYLLKKSSSLEPTEALKQRLEKNTRTKLLKVDD